MGNICCGGENVAEIGLEGFCNLNFCFTNLVGVGGDTFNGVFLPSLVCACVKKFYIFIAISVPASFGSLLPPEVLLFQEYVKLML